ncbi:MAG: hypothetical protein DMD91_15550 [Candidatus Rokuibacteriota bacterium]|nr:MAG: hypothetical protein DMD91_15550 [Candidatus Rokubacteria bacterium]
MDRRLLPRGIHREYRKRFGERFERGFEKSTNWQNVTTDDREAGRHRVLGVIGLGPTPRGR